MPVTLPAPPRWRRDGYGVALAPAQPDGSGNVPSMYNPAPSSSKSPNSPILCAVYIPPGHAREPDKVYLSAAVFGGPDGNQDPQNVITLHVSVGPLSIPLAYEDRRVLYLPGISTGNPGGGFTPKEVCVDPSPLEARGQTLVSLHSVPLYSESDNHNTRNPFVLDLDGHPGEPETDGLLVVAHAGAGCVLQLAVTPMPKSRQRMQQVCGQPMTREDAMMRGVRF